MDKVNEYSTDVLVKSEYGYDVLPPAPPEGCKYVYDPKTGAVLSMECTSPMDSPIDVFVPPVKDTPMLEPVFEPVKDVPLDVFVGVKDDVSVTGSTFPMWDTLTCDEILKNIDKIKTDLTMMRLTQEAMAVYDKQLAYAKQVYEAKCQKAPVDVTPIDADILVGTGGIKTPVDTPVKTGGGGVPVFVGETPAPVVTPAPVKKPASNLWWIAAAVVGIYLITRKK